MSGSRGLVDSHSHPVWGLHLTTGVDLVQVGDLDGLRAALVSAERIDGWVVGAALAAGEADVAGRIAVGFRADLTVLAVDPATAPADEVAHAPVQLTITGGHIAHRGA